MISQQVQGVWSGAVCNQANLTDWQNVIPCGGTKIDNVIIIRSHGSLTGKCYHQNCRTQTTNKLFKCRVLRQQLKSTAKVPNSAKRNCTWKFEFRYLKKYV